MTHTEQRRPGGETEAAAVSKGSATDSSVADSIDFDARRRAAARRLPPLERGTGDPLDRLACEQLPDLPRNWQAARRTWSHFADLGYISPEVLTDPAAREFWLRALGVAA